MQDLNISTTRAIRIAAAIAEAQLLEAQAVARNIFPKGVARQDTVVAIAHLIAVNGATLAANKAKG